MYKDRTVFADAFKICENQNGGPLGNQPGWLMGIHDVQTENFVKSLLAQRQKAFIGLYRSDGENFEWAGGNPTMSNYTGLLTQDMIKLIEGRVQWRGVISVTLSRSGWQLIPATRRRTYVCQVYAKLAIPTVSCPPSEEGKPQMSVVCTVFAQKAYGAFRNVIVKRGEDTQVLKCNLHECTTSLAGFAVQMRESDPVKQVNKTINTTITAHSLTSRSDDGEKWSCSYEFEGIRGDMLVSDCIKHTYVIPKAAECALGKFGIAGVSVVCEVRGAYPKPESIWLHYIDGVQQSELQPQVEFQVDMSDNVVMFHALFTGHIAGMAEVTPGHHKIDITIYPDVPFVSAKARLQASISRSVEFTISIPNKPPLFFTGNGMDIQQGRLTVDAGETVTLVCEVDGGSPQVSKTVIECSESGVGNSFGNGAWDQAGQHVSARLLITRDMDQRVCTCRAQHVSKLYKKTAHVTFNVPHAAEVVSFTVNQKLKEFELPEGESVQFLCSAQGNPTPQLNLYKISNDGKTQTTLQKPINTSITYDVSKASCDMSGTYVCSAENSLSTETSEQRVNVRVRCRPQPCSQRESDREFSIVPGKDFNFKMCVFAYPKPHSHIRISPRGKPDIDELAYSARFIYTNSLETEMYIVVDMFSSAAQPGNHTIKIYQSSLWHDIEFSLVPYQKPSCPESLNTTAVDNTFVALSWTPGSDHGILQTFIVSTTNNEDHVVSTHYIEDNGETVMSYNVTDLGPYSDYSFRLSVQNEIGAIECPHLVANVSNLHIPPAPDAVTTQTSLVSDIDSSAFVPGDGVSKDEGVKAKNPAMKLGHRHYKMGMMMGAAIVAAFGLVAIAVFAFLLVKRKRQVGKQKRQSLTKEDHSIRDVYKKRESMETFENIYEMIDVLPNEDEAPHVVDIAYIALEDNFSGGSPPIPSRVRSPPKRFEDSDSMEYPYTDADSVEAFCNSRSRSGSVEDDDSEATSPGIQKNLTSDSLYSLAYTISGSTHVISEAESSVFCTSRSFSKYKLTERDRVENMSNPTTTLQSDEVVCNNDSVHGADADSTASYHNLTSQSRSFRGNVSHTVYDPTYDNSGEEPIETHTYLSFDSAHPHNSVNEKPSAVYGNSSVQAKWNEHDGPDFAEIYDDAYSNDSGGDGRDDVEYVAPDAEFVPDDASESRDDVEYVAPDAEFVPDDASESRDDVEYAVPDAEFVPSDASERKDGADY